LHFERPRFALDYNCLKFWRLCYDCKEANILRFFDSEKHIKNKTETEARTISDYEIELFDADGEISFLKLSSQTGKSQRQTDKTLLTKLQRLVFVSVARRSYLIFVFEKLVEISVIVEAELRCDSGDRDIRALQQLGGFRKSLFGHVFAGSLTEALSESLSEGGFA
jgi:hypothetical protein